MEKKQKNAQKYLYSRLLTTNEYIMHFKKLEKLSRSKANIIDFWAM